MADSTVGSGTRVRLGDALIACSVLLTGFGSYWAMGAKVDTTAIQLRADRELDKKDLVVVAQAAASAAQAAQESALQNRILLEKQNEQAIVLRDHQVNIDLLKHSFDGIQAGLAAINNTLLEAHRALPKKE